MRIVSYNVRYFGHGTRGLMSTRNAVVRIAEAIAALDPIPAIICLQEVETASLRATVADPKNFDQETQLGRFMQALETALSAANNPVTYEAYYFPAHTYQLAPNVPFYTTGLAIIAHEDFKIDYHNADDPIDITHRHLHPIRGLKQTRICAHARFRYRGDLDVDVFNTHLSLPSTMSKEFWTAPKRLGHGPNQLEEAKTLVEFVDSERKSSRFFITGDFNSMPMTPVYDYLTREAGLQDAFAQTCHQSEAELAEWPTAGFMRMRMRLDHIFSGEGIEWHDFDETHKFGDASGRFHGLSDHVPIIGRCHGRDDIDPVD